MSLSKYMIPLTLMVMINSSWAEQVIVTSFSGYISDGNSVHSVRPVGIQEASVEFRVDTTHNPEYDEGKTDNTDRAGLNKITFFIELDAAPSYASGGDLAGYLDEVFDSAPFKNFSSASIDSMKDEALANEERLNKIQYLAYKAKIGFKANRFSGTEMNKITTRNRYTWGYMPVDAINITGNYNPSNNLLRNPDALNAAGSSSTAVIGWTYEEKNGGSDCSNCSFRISFLVYGDQGTRGKTTSEHLAKVLRMSDSGWKRYRNLLDDKTLKVQIDLNAGPNRFSVALNNTLDSSYELTVNDTLYLNDANTLQVAASVTRGHENDELKNEVGNSVFLGYSRDVQILGRGLIGTVYGERSKNSINKNDDRDTAAINLKVLYNDNMDLSCEGGKNFYTNSEDETFVQCMVDVEFSGTPGWVGQKFANGREHIGNFVLDISDSVVDFGETVKNLFPKK